MRIVSADGTPRRRRSSARTSASARGVEDRRGTRPYGRGVNPTRRNHAWSIHDNPCARHHLRARCLRRRGRTQRHPGGYDHNGGATASTERYCELVGQLDAAGEEFFAGLGEDASPEEFEAAERRFVERYDDELEAVGRSAPAEIRDDVQKLLAGTRRRAGLEAPVEVTEAEASAAEERVQAFEERACG